MLEYDYIKRKTNGLLSTLLNFTDTTGNVPSREVSRASRNYLAYWQQLAPSKNKIGSVNTDAKYYTRKRRVRRDYHFWFNSLQSVRWIHFGTTFCSEMNQKRFTFWIRLLYVVLRIGLLQYVEHYLNVPLLRISCLLRLFRL